MVASYSQYMLMHEQPHNNSEHYTTAHTVTSMLLGMLLAEGLMLRFEVVVAASQHK